MAEPMIVEVVSPERVLFSGEATMVITRTLGGGEIAFLAGHAPFLGALIENHTRVFLADGTVAGHRRPRRLRRGQQQQGVDPVRRRRARPTTSTSSAPSAAMERAEERMRQRAATPRPPAPSSRATRPPACRRRHRLSGGVGRSTVDLPVHVGARHRGLVAGSARRWRGMLADAGVADRRRRPPRRPAGRRSPSAIPASRCSSPTWRPTTGRPRRRRASPTTTRRSTSSSTTPGSAPAATFHELDPDRLADEIELNVAALTRLSHAALAAMVPRRRGWLLNVSSVASFQPAPRLAVYAATKAYVTSLTESLHEEVERQRRARDGAVPGPDPHRVPAASATPSTTATTYPGDRVDQRRRRRAHRARRRRRQQGALACPGAQYKVLSALIERRRRAGSAAGGLGAGATRLTHTGHGVVDGAELLQLAHAVARRRSGARCRCASASRGSACGRRGRRSARRAAAGRR